MLHRVPQEYLQDETYGEQWRTLSTKWSHLLNTFYCPTQCDSVNVTKVGNLKNHDLLIEYHRGGNVVHSVLGEFKHNSSSIESLPEYYNAPEKKRYIPVSYAEYFYDNYLPKVCEATSVQMIQKDEYLKYIYQPNYSAHPFFQQLKDSEESCYSQKQQIVRESIKEYLTSYASELSLSQLTNDVMSQKNKTFILWDCKNFYSDQIKQEELEMANVERIKNNNTIVVVSKAGTKHNMLLRWKNHLGVLYPAWQISLER
jgi:hypothetical protein